LGSQKNPKQSKKIFQNKIPKEQKTVPKVSKKHWFHSL